jgi:hypothetical protein
MHVFLYFCVTVLQADFLSLGGTAFAKRADKASPLLVAVLGSNAQTMSTFVSTQKLMLGLLGEKYTHDEVAKAVVDAAYRTFKTVDAGNAAKTLVHKANLMSLYSATYKSLTSLTRAPSSSGRHLLQATLTDAQLDSLFGAVASAVSSTNTQVQTVVAAATAAAADPTSTVDTSAMLVDVSKMATVQQESLAKEVGTLATTFAADPTANVAALEDVSRTHQM